MPHPCLYFDVKFLLESLQKHQKRRIFVQLLTTTACCTTSLMTDRVSKISFMGFGSSIQKFYEFFGLCDDISKAEQEKTLKNQASNMPPKKEAKFLLKIHFQILPLPPFFGLFPGTRFITKYYSFHHGLVVHTNLSIQIFNGLG